MDVEDEGTRFWRASLLAGGMTPVPRWAAWLGPAPGPRARHAAGAEGLGGACLRLAADLSVPADAVLLAAHVKVVAALTGQADVVTGYRPTDAGGALPVRVETGDGTWRDLVRAVAGVRAAVHRHRDHPVAALARELRLPEPLFETVLDLGRPAGPRLEPGSVAGAGLQVLGDAVRLVLCYDPGAMDEEYAARVAGYHLNALRLMTADPGASHRAAGLLGPDEVRCQLQGLAGPRRDLPDRRFHELFDERARTHPDLVAAEHAGRRWTYGELRGHAQRVARALVARGAGREDVVAVVTERGLEWLAAVVGILTAGCAYLPVEPGFPPDRVAAMLSRSGCRLALTAPGSDGPLRRAAASVPGVDVVSLATVLAGADGDGDDVAVPVAAGQLAYVLFTSGSTGEPKGAMIQHDGLLNHLLAKVEDLDIGPGVVVAQTAPQCFDISVWQLLAALLAGGTTLIVEPPVLLDVERLVDTLAVAGVGVLQLVPSHLEVVLSHLERRPRRLRWLRRVSVTGEAVSPGLVERWFACQPDVPLVNAYGLTETSDDTNHEIMLRPPAGDRVPVGRPIANVHVSVVDENGLLAPLGATGEIVFSGVCVGRGYVNDERLTRRAFGLDPHRQGLRTYRSGDFGRWLPGGSLEFLGRRDAQVKVRGFRIEIGEVEHRLDRMEGVRDCAVVVPAEGGRAGELIAFYSGPAPLPREELRDFLGRSLPEYMIPAHLDWLPALPLTGNGKTDRRALARLAAAGAAEDGREEPATATERWLAGAWAEALGVPAARVGRDDHFFERGGTSLSAVRLVIGLDRRVSLEELAAHPVLRDLALLLDREPGAAPRAG